LCAPPEEEEEEPSSPPVPIEGTIAWVKDQDDSTSVSLTGKVVTAVFHNPTDFFYIEEADGSS